MTLQLQTIPCGTKYLNQTIGLSITNNYLYQFILINKTIQIIRYDYKKLIIKNNDNDYKLNDENDYKYNLFNGQMLSNGLNDLIPENIVKKLMKVIQWTLDESNKYKDLHNIEKQQNNNNNLQPIISMSMSINNNGKIRIYCVKSFDQFVYIIGDYNQKIDMTTMEILYYAINPEQSSIMGTISYENNGIITFIYSKLSYQIKMFKLSENSYGNQDFKSLKQLAIDESLTTIYQFNEKLDEHQQQTLTNSFGQIFGQHQFTYGFVDQNQINLFTNQDEKLLKFSMDTLKLKTKQKYPFEMKLYKKFFDCKNNENFDDFFTIKVLTEVASTKKFKTTTITNTNNASKSKNNDNNNHNNDNEQPFFHILYLSIAIIIFGPLLIILLIICYRNCNYYYQHKQMNKKNKLQEQQQSLSSYNTLSIFQNPQKNYFINKQDNTNNGLEEKKILDKILTPFSSFTATSTI